MTRGVVVTGSNTNVGKTLVTRALVLALRAHGVNAIAVKPIETGVIRCPEDALALARASEDPTLASLPAFYRHELPLSPLSISKRTGFPAPNLAAILDTIRQLAERHDLVIVEGAGGVLSPLGPGVFITDLAKALGWPVILVVKDELGAISQALCTRLAAAKESEVACIVMSRHSKESEDHIEGVRMLVEEPVVSFAPKAPCREDERRSAAAGLSALVLDATRPTRRRRDP